jgi:hypothetical protein
MEGIIKFLRDPAWQGIAGIAALITLSIYVLDKSSLRIRIKLNGIGQSTLVFLKNVAFACYGLIWGLPLMVLMGLIADFIDYLAPSGARIPGSFGLFLLKLSHLRLFLWGFNPSISDLNLQFGVLGLYGGALAGLAFFLYKRYSAKMNFSSIPRFHHYLAVFVLIDILLIGLTNLLDLLFL